MSTEAISLNYTPGKTLYPILINSSGQVFDWSDNTFKAAGSVVTPSGTVTEAAIVAGISSLYQISDGLDLERVNATFTSLQVWEQWREQVGASKSLANDPPVTDLVGYTVAAGYRDPLLDLVLIPGFRKDLDPQVATWWVAVTANGQTIDLTSLAGSHDIAISVRKDDATGTELIAATSTTLDGQGRFVVTFSTPGYADDRTCFARYTINSVLVRDRPFYTAK